MKNMSDSRADRIVHEPTVLIVDDDRANREIIDETLKDENYHLTLTANSVDRGVLVMDALQQLIQVRAARTEASERLSLNDERWNILWQALGRHALSSAEAAVLDDPATSESTRLNILNTTFSEDEETAAIDALGARLILITDNSIAGNSQPIPPNDLDPGNKTQDPRTLVDRAIKLHGDVESRKRLRVLCITAQHDLLDNLAQMVIPTGSEGVVTPEVLGKPFELDDVFNRVADFDNETAQA